MTQDEEVRLVMKAALKLYYVKSEDWDTEKMAQEAMKMLTGARKAVAEAHEGEAAQLNKPSVVEHFSNDALVQAFFDEGLNCYNGDCSLQSFQKYRREILARMERASPPSRIPDELRTLSAAAKAGEWEAVPECPSAPTLYCVGCDLGHIASTMWQSDAKFAAAAVNHIRAQIAQEDAK